MIGPAAGAARRLAGIEASGTLPKVATSSGDTAAWAETVTASGAANQRGPGSRRSRRPAPTTIPPAPRTDSRNPSDVVSSGSTSTMAVTPSASVRSVDAGRPAATPTAATAAMPAARRTEGSARVTSANPARTVSVAASRGPKESRDSSGAAITRTNAMFCPDTASRCVSPAARKASVMSGGCARSSPRVSPASRLRCRSGSPSAPVASVRRRPLAAVLAGSPGRHPTTVSTTSRPARCRYRTKPSYDPGACTDPRTVTRSPASRSSRAAAADARATARRRRPPSRTSTLTPPRPSGSGSPTSVTSARNGPVSSGASRPATLR